MKPRMTEAEAALFRSFVSCSKNYVEFGAGGSTCVAVELVKTCVTSVDSSSEWLANVAQFCKEDPKPIVPRLIHVDIGPTRDWGYPADESQRDKWPSYHSGIWDKLDKSDADLYFVDGRFRVACFMQAILHCKVDSLILIHDFASRSDYHIVREVAREIAMAEDLSVFQPLRIGVKSRAQEILERYWFVTE